MDREEMTRWEDMQTVPPAYRNGLETIATPPPKEGISVKEIEALERFLFGGGHKLNQIKNESTRL